MSHNNDNQIHDMRGLGVCNFQFAIISRPEFPQFFGVGQCQGHN
jgi:hypothetical protein